MGSSLIKQASAWVFVTVGFFAGVISSCDTIAVTSVVATAVEVSPKSAELVTGQSVQLSAMAVDGVGAQIQSASIEWSATPSEIAQVDRSGRVTALAPGVATITATTSGVVGSAAVAVGVPGLLALSSTQVVFSSMTGSGAPPSQTVLIGAGDGMVAGLEAHISYGDNSQGWLTTEFSSDRAPSVLSIGAATDALSAGVYAATIEISSTSARNGPQALRVELVVADPLPIIEVSPTTLTLVGAETQSVQVRNIGLGELTGLTSTIEYPAGGPTGWLSVGLSSDAAPATFVIGSDDSQLVPGTYTARVVVGSSNLAVAPVSIGVQLAGGQQNPTLVLGVGSAQLSAAVGGTATAAVNVLNGGTGHLDGLGATVAYASGQTGGWLVGSLSASTAPSVLTLVASTSGLSPGNYSASVEVVGNAPNSPVFFPVTLTVTTGSGPTPAAPSGFSAVATSSWSIALGWLDNSSNESGFDIRKRGSSGHWQIWRTTSPNVTSAVDKGVGPSSAYDYQIRACNALGCSGWTPVVSVVTP